MRLPAPHGPTGRPRLRKRRVAVLASMLASAAILAEGPPRPGPEGAAAPIPDPLPTGWYARIETSLGEILVLLHPEQAPQSVAHFAALADARLAWENPVSGEVAKTYYYDGQTVVRAHAGQNFEVGDPLGTGTSAPEVYVPPEVNQRINFTVGGKMGLPRAPLGRINAAEFFITASPQPHLTIRHPCIGTVVRGKDVVSRIAGVKTFRSGRPREPVTIRRLRIVAKGDPDPLPQPVPYTPKGLSFELREDG